jgi:DNA ligase-1
MFTIHETLPTLYGKDISGKSKQWTATVFTDGQRARYTVEYGQVGGKLQTTSTDYTEGKNIGKKNETTPLQQCCSEIRKKWADKKEKERYSETMDDSDAGGSKVFPMLAHVYDPKKNTRILYPCFVQPKLDGLRCLIYKESNGSIVTQSRTGGFYATMGHITNGLTQFFEIHPTAVLDGELYTNIYPFEELCGIIKRTTKLSDADLEKLRFVHFHIYDVVLPKSPYTDRYAFIVQNAHLFPPSSFEIVKTEEVTNVTEFKQKFTEYIQEGYEGIMLRNKKGLYVNNRSHDLQKYKEFEEDEFVIVGFEEARGRDAGSVIWICATKTGEKFDCRPIGSLEHRSELFRNASTHIGKMLTVKFQELSENGIPRFPSGKAIREGY